MSDVSGVKRQKCEVYTRIMGYFRPVHNFNIGKRSEFYSRQYFDCNTSMASAIAYDNGKFRDEYGKQVNNGTTS